MRSFFICVVALLLLSFGTVSLKKRISDADFRYEFYTTDQAVSPEPERMYYWFKGGAIHNSEFGIGGEVLHKDFLKFYHSNQLAEAGQYDEGLKKGYWKTWFPSGILQSKTYWDDGQKDGTYYSYDETGFLVEEGKFRNNKKHGRWINYISKDTLKYKDGIIVLKKVKVKKDTLNARPGFIKRLFTRKNKETVPAGTEATVTKKNRTESDRPGFLKRLFTRKDKKEDVTEPKKKKDDGFLKRLFSKKKRVDGQGS